MISKKFQTLALGATLALSSAFAAPAMAGTDSAICLPADKAKIVLTKDSGVKIADFTKSSAGCLQKYANGMSRTQLLLVADGDFQAWRDVNIEAAKQLRQEGKPTNVFFTGVTDGDDQTADTIIWANGVKRSISPLILKEGYSVPMIVHAQNTYINEVKIDAESTWNKYLKRPEQTASLALK